MNQLRQLGTLGWPFRIAPTIERAEAEIVVAETTPPPPLPFEPPVAPAALEGEQALQPVG